MQSFDANDPRLTAYVLGELEEPDRVAIEQQLQACAESRAAVEEIREAIGLLENEFAAEPVTGLSTTQRSEIESALTAEPTDAVTPVGLAPVGVAPTGKPSAPSGRSFAVIAATLTAGATVCVAVGMLMLNGTDADSRDMAATFANDEAASAKLAQPEPAELVASLEGASERADALQIEELARESRFDGKQRVLAGMKDGYGLGDSGVAAQKENADFTQPTDEAPSSSEFGVLLADIGNPKKGADKNGLQTTITPTNTSRFSDRSAVQLRVAGGSEAKAEGKSSHPGQAGANRARQLRSVESKAVGNRPQLQKEQELAQLKTVGDILLTKVKDVTELTKSAPLQAGQGLGGAAPTAADKSGYSLPAAGPQTSMPKIAAKGLAPTGQTPAPAPTGQTTDLYVVDPTSTPGSTVRGGAVVNSPVTTGRVLRENLATLPQPVSGTPGTVPEVAFNLQQAGQGGAVRAITEVDGIALRYLPTAPQEAKLELQRGRNLYGRTTANTEWYAPIVDNAFTSPLQHPLSTFSIDVDTGAYANVRRFLDHNQLPPADAVRIEELINYFHYDYPQPTDGRPFSVNIAVNTCPWQPDHRLVHVGLKGREIAKENRPPTNLVFLLDVSGSMRDAAKLPLVKSAMQMLVEEMTEDDRIAIVTYAGNAGLVLDSTTGADKASILSAIDNLNAGGSTNGEAGIKLAYSTAVTHFVKGGSNRIILCTDGDFNVGVSNDDELVSMIQGKAKSGVFLSIFGFGMGNLKDAKLEQLADKGNGHYGYIDNKREARKSFVEELAGTLYTIAKDVKVQVEFNPARVGMYRLIGYANRILAAEDFNDDSKDAGEIGAGHTVTALYEIVPIDKMPPTPAVDPLKYQTNAAEAAAQKQAITAGQATKEMLTLKLRYKEPEGERSVKMEFPVVDNRAPSAESPATVTSHDETWSAAVAGFGMLLRDSKHKGNATYATVLEMAQAGKGVDKSGRRQEMIDLIHQAHRIHAQQTGQPTPRPPQLPELEAREKASVNGKYSRLLKTIEVPDDFAQYGEFRDFGKWTGKSYAGHENLPEGHWVYVYPKWYIWGDMK